MKTPSPARRLGLLGAALAATLGLAACNTTPKASQASVDHYVGQAKALAGNDLQFLLPVCNPQPAQRMGNDAVQGYLQKVLTQTPPEPTQVFDNLYYVGSAWVSAWVLKTSEGLILIDALNNALEAQGLIEGGMARLGLNPKDIKYLIVTHGHGDHYGGATALVQKYGVRVVASEIDWKMMETGLEFDAPLWGRPPQRDISVKDGDRLTLGDTTLTLYVTPGHTLGTLSPVFDVRSQGKTYKALMWGGTSFNFGQDLARLDSYTAAADRMAGLSRQAPFDLLLSNHPGWDDTVKKMAALKAAPAGTHPFVSGASAVERSLQVMGTCARAQKDRFLMTAAS